MQKFDNNYVVSAMLDHMDPGSRAGARLQAQRVNRRGGRPVGTRKVRHDPAAHRCLCVECRIARGNYTAAIPGKRKAVSGGSKPKQPKTKVRKRA